MATGTNRRVCTTCGEELAHAVYFRHLHNLYGTVCPGKKQIMIINTEEDNESSSTSSLDSFESAVEPEEEPNSIIIL